MDHDLGNNPWYVEFWPLRFQSQDSVPEGTLGLCISEQRYLKGRTNDKNSSFLHLIIIFFPT